MTSDCTISVLRDVLSVYDHRFLGLDGPQRDRLVDGTLRILGTDGLDEATRAALPASYRLRAFCIRHGLREELEQLIRDEAAGNRAGAVVVGGRVYALYPYLRGVSRQDADITAEVGVEHRLDAVGRQGFNARIRGRAALEQVETRRTDVELVLRKRGGSGAEHRFPAVEREDGFEAFADLTLPGPGRWDVHVSATTLGVTREARFGTVRGPRLNTDTSKQGIVSAGDATVYFTKGGHLAVLVRGESRPVPLSTRIRRRLIR
ncbi:MULTISPECIES: hypothetical protein [Thermomonosporaceae]|uniref:hypothetical protein n=1 Tax=Thermomonosporaceae TaxID=2012 RepID=UPI00255B2A48|nr:MULTISPECIES: hypothetical protein [Thermomonosporaceae]MDL4771748.1 hypothetical protein [Actinomadura xylanilytica]